MTARVRRHSIAFGRNDAAGERQLYRRCTTRDGQQCASPWPRSPTDMPPNAPNARIGASGAPPSDRIEIGERIRNEEV